MSAQLENISFIKRSDEQFVEGELRSAKKQDFEAQVEEIGNVAKKGYKNTLWYLKLMEEVK